MGDSPGIFVSELDTWRDFTPLLIEQILQYGGQAIWRGQSSAAWQLETSFDRAARNSGVNPTESLAKTHLQRFKRAARGRRIVLNRSELTEDGWWALGQHYGLATPLLDWTYAPYVALYFAFLDAACSDPDKGRAVWGFNSALLEELNGNAGSGKTFRLLDPLVDENARLVNQNGVFTRGPVGVTFDDWARTTDVRVQQPLWKFVIRDMDRDDCLRHLNQMNINHVTLFPDLDGASRHCNHQLSIRNY